MLGKGRDGKTGRTHQVDLHNPQFLAGWVDIFNSQKNFNLYNPPHLAYESPFFLSSFFPSHNTHNIWALYWCLYNIGRLHSFFFFFWTMLLIIFMVFGLCCCLVDYEFILCCSMISLWNVNFLMCLSLNIGL